MPTDDDNAYGSLNGTVAIIVVTGVLIFVATFICFCYILFKKSQLSNSQQVEYLRIDIADSDSEFTELEEVAIEIDDSNKLNYFSKVEHPITLCWKNINYEVNNQWILKNISGYVQASNVLCILGQSGAGKTSLLEILCGVRNNKKFICGEVYYNDILTKTLQNYDCSSYVSQNVILNDDLTVRECITYICRLKKCNIGKVNDVISCLRLEKCQNTLIKNISFGERKRCSIAGNLLNQTPILFLDEILTGLDSTAAYKVFDVINQLKELGHSIILSLHQPSNRLFEMMQKHGYSLMILQNGKTVYFGKAENCLPYFQSLGFKKEMSSNQAEFFIDTVDGDKNEQMMAAQFQSVEIKKIEQSIDEIVNNAYDTETALTIHKQNISIFEQVSILTQRAILCDLRNIEAYWIKTFCYAGIAGMCGAIFYHVNDTENAVQNHLGYAFYTVQFLSLVSFTSLAHFINGRSLFISQRMNNDCSAFAYGMSKLLSSIPWSLLNALAVSLIIASLVQPRSDPDIFYFVWFFLCVFALLVASDSFGNALSMMSSRYMINFVVLAGVVGVYTVFTGSIVIKSDIPSYLLWLYYISYYNYSFKFIMFLDLRNGDPLTLYEGIQLTGNQVLDMYEMNDVNLLHCVFALIAMAIVYQFIFYLELKYWIKLRSD